VRVSTQTLKVAPSSRRRATKRWGYISLGVGVVRISTQTLSNNCLDRLSCWPTVAVSRLQSGVGLVDRQRHREVGLVGPVGYREIGRPWTVDVGVGRLVDHMMCVHVRR
jgi:hypothetical protein